MRALDGREYVRANGYVCGFCHDHNGCDGYGQYHRRGWMGWDLSEQSEYDQHGNVLIRGSGCVDHGRREKRMVDRGRSDCGHRANRANNYDLNGRGHHENAHGVHGRKRSCQLY